MVWVHENEGYECNNCNAFFYIKIISPEEGSGFRDVTHCPLCGDDDLAE